MSTLALSKLYGDLTLFFKADIDTMWTELEAKVNGNIDDDNVAQNWASWNQVTLAKDTDYTLGTTDTGIVRFYSSTNEFVFAHDTTARNTIFKINSVEIARVDTSANFKVDTDLFFYNRNTTYGMAWLLQYQKPVLVYINSTTIDVEQNTVTANTTLITFPAGPIAVTEDTSAANKYRRFISSATANGYASGHTGAADSGMRTGLTLAANTWYFIYAVVVNYGDDAGDNFILVGDDTNPTPTNWATLDTRYGAGMWVYLGMFRRGFGTAQTTTIVPFLQDHQGWHTFTSRAAAGDFFGIKVASSAITFANYVTPYAHAVANSGNAAPANCSMVKLTVEAEADGDGDMMGGWAVGINQYEILHYMTSFGNNLTSSESHGWEVEIPNVVLEVLALRDSSGEDFTMGVFIAAVLDEWA